jgi:DNA mismatch repair protein MutS
MENLHDEIGRRTLFATHYHELADTAEGMARATCVAMDATAGRHGDVFTYKVLEGRAGKSYGLKAAALAGLPQAVLDRAAELMAAYENPDQGRRPFAEAKPNLIAVTP